MTAPTATMTANQKKKIPCSVSLITLNVEDSLGECLEALQDFAEIIVCDGNSTDRTREIAERFGARVIRQYDTDEPNTRCAMDKAAVRQRAMDASTLPWRFFMDADDTLSLEAVEEIRRITSDPSPAHLVWRMPTRIFIGGSEILHEATYPSYQTRLIHESVGAHFKNPVHDRLQFDAKIFPLGTMQNYYNFHWDPKRVANYWGYIGAYARRELQVAEFGGVWDVVRGFFKRTRTIAGYLLWRLPFMYGRYGFKNSMPLSIELQIVRYHMVLLFGLPWKYLRTRPLGTMLLETLRGKDINRTLANISIQKWEAYGRVLDVGGGHGTSSYWRFLQTRRWHKAVTLDISADAKPDILLDLEREALPFPDGNFDTALLFNVLEHIEHRDEVLAKLRHAVRGGGELIGVIPFLVNVHPDPHDFARLTEEGLYATLSGAGFSRIHIEPIGRGPFLAAYSLLECVLPRVVKVPLLPLMLGLDRLVLTARPGWRRKFPLSYAFKAS